MTGGIKCVDHSFAYVAPNDLIFTKTNDAVRLSAWLGWKQTVTCLEAEKPVIESKHKLQLGRQIFIY
jgi:hypothetical protein